MVIRWMRFLRHWGWIDVADGEMQILGFADVISGSAVLVFNSEIAAFDRAKALTGRKCLVNVKEAFLFL